MTPTSSNYIVYASQDTLIETCYARGFSYLPLFASIYCFVIDIQGVEGEEFEVTMETRSWWVSVAESTYLKNFFRAVSVVNLIVLVLSIPFYNLNQLEGNQEFIVSVQFQVITVLDFILSCIYTFNFVIRCIKTVTAKVCG